MLQGVNGDRCKDLSIVVGCGVAEAWLLTGSGLAIAHPRGTGHTHAALLADHALCQLGRQTADNGIQVAHGRAKQTETHSFCRISDWSIAAVS